MQFEIEGGKGGNSNTALRVVCAVLIIVIFGYLAMTVIRENLQSGPRPQQELEPKGYVYAPVEIGYEGPKVGCSGGYHGDSLGDLISNTKDSILMCPSCYATREMADVLYNNGTNLTNLDEGRPITGMTENPYDQNTPTGFPEKYTVYPSGLEPATVQINIPGQTQHLFCACGVKMLPVGQCATYINRSVENSDVRLMHPELEVDPNALMGIPCAAEDPPLPMVDLQDNVRSACTPLSRSLGSQIALRHKGEGTPLAGARGIWNGNYYQSGCGAIPPQGLPGADEIPSDQVRTWCESFTPDLEKTTRPILSKRIEPRANPLLYGNAMGMCWSYDNTKSEPKSVYSLQYEFKQPRDSY